MSVTVVNSGPATVTVSVESTPTVQVNPLSVNVVEISSGSQGATGPAGPAGEAGPAGDDGLGFTGGSYNPSTGVVTFTSDDGLGFSTGDLRGESSGGYASGGSENQFLQKNSATDYDTKWSAYTLPAADGNARQVLTTDGAGVVSFSYPQTIAEDVKNVSGGTLVKGTPVHVTGSVGNLAEVIAADAATNYPAHFVLDEDLLDDGEGKGIALGFINNIDVPDASIYTEGQTVYLGASGGWTTTKPTGTNAIQNLGVIIKVNTAGNKVSGIIMGAGRANDVPNIPNGQAWIGNASGVATPTTLATVATTGAYSDLSGTPSIPVSGVDFDPVGTDNSTDVTLAGSYDYLTISGQEVTMGQIDYNTDISNKPSLLDASGSPVNNQLAVWVDGNTLEGDTNLTWTGSALTVAGDVLSDSISTQSSASSLGGAGRFAEGSVLLKSFGAASTITAGNVCKFNSSGWSDARANTVANGSGLIGVASSASSNTGLVSRGVVQMSSNTGFSTATAGDVLYLSTTAGQVTDTAPSGTTGYIVRVVGYVIDASLSLIYFDPSKDWIELS